MRVRILICGLLVAISACSSTEKKTLKQSIQEEKEIKLFEEGLQHLDAERYEQAIKVFEGLRQNHSGSKLDLVVLYNLGAAFEGARNCPKASEIYRQVARSAKSQPRIEVSALFRLGYVYECLGEDNKVVVSLVDVLRRSKHLDEDTARAELPARLAGAYARLGNRQEAEKYFKQALKGIQFLQAKHKESRQLADTLAQSLFLMGKPNVSDRDWKENPVRQLKGLALTQLYLLQAAELESPKWSRRAADTIMESYDLVWKNLDSFSAEDVSDPQARSLAIKRQKQELLREALRSMRALKAQRIPRSQESMIIQNLFSDLENKERKVESQLTALGPYIPLSPEGEKISGLKRTGRVQSEKLSPLEKKAKSKK